MRALLSTALIIALIGSSTPAGADDGGLLIVNKASEKCLTVGVGDNTMITQWTCASGDAFQRWELLGGDHVKIRNKATRACLTVHGSGNGALASAAPCDEAGRWRLADRKGRWWELRPAGTSRCLDLNAASRSDGAAVQQWRCRRGANDNQTWLLV
ncbi:RICIN domain-containing protein [Actinoplanes sp. G11-F43]|uniref:RICIN domain-containing protein n=1 Tax=Actinoplanes sp. G11-F43 TaxID=3424130 RepID=UPI003D34F5C3